MIATHSNLLGIGLYTPAEAAFYARLHTRTLNRWLYGDGQGEPVIDPQRGREEKDVSFLDLMQALSIRAITTMPGKPHISLRKIREAVLEAKVRYGIEYPFAMEHVTYLLGDTVIIKCAEDDYRPLTGSSKGNRLLTEVVEVCKKKIVYGPEGLATQYNAWGSEKSSIVLDPLRRFGEPMFPAYGYTAQTLWDAVTSEGSVAAAARAYGVPEEAILVACEYRDHLQGTTSA